MKTLTLAKDLTLPLLEAVTQTFAILGKRGSGKTTTATVLVEELLAANQHVVLLDPLDVTWGLRASRDGKSAGFPITVLGGDHADLPLEASAGAVIAEFVVEHHAPLILSLRHFSMADQRRFVTDFCERLYALKGKQQNRTALHLVIDEADEFAPQRIPSGHERMFGSIDRIVRRGRASGLGVTLISQRAAVLHKDVLSQAEVLICHQTVSPQDRKALEAWIDAHDAHGQGQAFMGSLASLQRGEAWVWSPGWLNVFQRVQVRDRTTFDSSATPKAGQVSAAPKQLAAVDLKVLEDRMSATIEKAKADDPRELRKALAEKDKRIKQLEAGTSGFSLSNEKAKPEVKPILTDADRELLLTVGGKLGELKELLLQKPDTEPFDTAVFKVLTKNLEALESRQAVVRERFLGLCESKGLQKILGKLEGVAIAAPGPGRVTAPLSRVTPQSAIRSAATPPPAARATSGNVGKAEQRVLDSLAWWKSAGIERPSRHQIAFVAGYTVNGHFNNTLGALNTSGLASYPGPGLVTLTEAGHNQAAWPTETTDRAALIAKVRDVLRQEPQRRVFDVLVQAGRDLPREELATSAGYTVNGHFNNTVGSLNSLGVVRYPGRGTVALGEMFDV